jgi:hypothetical protein
LNIYVTNNDILNKGGQPAAQKEFFAAQSCIKNQRFVDILGVFSQFSNVPIVTQKINSFDKFSKLRLTDQFGLATPVVIKFR